MLALSRKVMQQLSERDLKTCLIIFIALSIWLPDTTVWAQFPTDTITYTVKDGDSLTDIATQYGDLDFWKPIFEANQDKISDPDKIYAGQKLIIPSSVTSSEKFVQRFDQEPANNITESEGKNDQDNEVRKSPNKAEEDSSKTEEDSSKTIEKFREAFQNVVDQQENEKEQEETKSDPTNLEFGGLVMNKTTSRMGRDFFKAFNDQWQNPEEAGNFMLEISEQPVPSMGTMVVIRIDNQIAYKARLQPRQDAIQKKVQQSIIMCYRYLHQQLSSSSQPNIY